MGSERVDRDSGEAVEVQRVAPAAAPEGRQIRRSSTLVVGAVDDPAEHEADRMAASVVSILRSGSPDTGVPAAASGDGGRIRRSAVGAEGGPIDKDTESRIQSSRGGGSPLAPDIESKMGSAFGADFSRVRVHSGAQSKDLNNRIQAKAFTVGSDVYFRDGAPDASSSSGQQLLAHELTHTIQQGGAVHRTPASGAARSVGRIRRGAQRTIQREAVTALVVTEVRKPDATDATKVDDGPTGVSAATIKPGGSADVDFAVTAVGMADGAPYVQVKKVGKKDLDGKGMKRYVRSNAVAKKGASATPPPKSKSDQTGKAIDKGSKTAGILPEINDAQDAFKARGNAIAPDMEKGMGIASGAGDTIAMFTGLAAAIVAFRDPEAKKSDKAGAVLSGASAIGGGAKGAAAMADKGGAGGAADSAAKGLAGFADAFAGIKDTFFAIKHVIELCQKADSMNDKEKFKAVMQVVTDAMSAAKSGVSSVKAFMDLWGGGAAAPLIGAVPGLGIALSAVDIIIRGVDLVDALLTRNDMQNRKRALKESKLGGEQGTTLKPVAEAFIKKIDADKQAGKKIKKEDLEKYAKYEEYLLAKGLQYISSKRAGRAFLKIGVAMAKMAGDITTLGGVSAPVGVGIKAGAMALDVGASVFRRFKQWGRDKAAEKEDAAGGVKQTGFWGLFNTDKSSTKKLEGYNKMVDKIFEMIIKVTTITVPDEQLAAAEQVKAFVGAMGLSLKQMDAKKGDPDALRMAMVTAMKKRE